VGVGSPEIPKVGIPLTLGAITLCEDLWWTWGLKQSCSPRRNLSNVMSHATCTQGNWGKSWLLVVGNQIGNLTLDPSFGYNLCFKCPNGSCESILDNYVPRAFQWYKKLLHPMSFDPCNCYLKIWNSIGTPTPKVGAHLGVWGFIPSHSPTLPGAWNVTSGPHTRPAPFISPCLGREPKAKVTTWWVGKWVGW
jgi:hypothetical protein